jgi:hypothetical protein
MQFKSKAQIEKMAKLEKEGKVKKGTVAKGMKETKSPGKLPTRLKPKSTDDLRSTFKSRFGIK